MEEKKKKRIRSGGVSIPHDLMVDELLTRLPAKSLMRFKCVSKLWCSTILDPAFCKLHRARSRTAAGPRISVLIDLLGEWGSGFGFLRRATLCRRRGVLDLLGDDVFYLPDLEGTTEVINGLVCLYTADRVSICNVSTREIMDLPLCHLDRSHQKIHSHLTRYQYYLGFDSTCNSEYPYKLLRACTFVAPFVVDGEDIYHITECEILTVGKDSSWRVVEGLPGLPLALHLWDQSVYIDGLLCWWNLTHRLIIGFCFKDEELLVISPPSRGQKFEGSLYQCRGRLALVGGLVDRKLELWVFQEEEEKSNYGGGRGGETVSPLYKWMKHVIDIPYAFSADRDCKLIGNLPTGAMLMTCGILEEEEEKVKEKEEEINSSSTSPVMAMPPIVSYDLTTGKFENFVIANEFPTPQDSIISDPNMLRISYYEEDISPLSLMISNK